MNLNRAIHITRHNLRVEVRLEKAVPKPKGTTNKWLEYWKIILDALSKQKAKKPDIWGDGYADGHLVYDMWNCPTCNKSYELDYDDYDFCPHCGQKLDWEEYKNG